MAKISSEYLACFLELLSPSFGLFDRAAVGVVVVPVFVFSSCEDDGCVKDIVHSYSLFCAALHVDCAHFCGDCSSLVGRYGC